MTKIKLFILFFLIITICYPQNKERFTHYSTENGLSQNDVNTIYQDAQGFMWFGTHDGLNRFDGYNFKVFKPISNDENSLSSNLIWKIIGDKNGNLWIATTGGGINFFDKKTEKFTRFKNELNNPKSLSNNHVFNIFLDSKDRLWVSTDVGLDLLDLKKSLKNPEFIHYKITTNEIISNSIRVENIYEDTKKKIWIGTQEGVYKLTRDKKGEHYFRNLTELIGLPKSPVVNIMQDQFERFYFVTEIGLYILDSKENKMQLSKISDTNFNEIISKNSYLWAGSVNGLYCFSNKSKNKTPVLIKKYNYDPKYPENSINKDNVRSIFIDNSGSLWIGMNGGGINKSDPNKSVFKHINKGFDVGSLSNNNIRALYEDSNGCLWVGTDGGGINMLPQNNSNYSNFIKFNNNITFTVKEIKVGNRKKLLFGSKTSPVLSEVDITNPHSITNASFITIPSVKSSVYSIFQDSQKNIWIGTYGTGIQRWLVTPTLGVYKKDNLFNDKSNPNSISNNIIRNIMEDKKGNLWFGTGEGLCKLIPSEIKKPNPKFIVFKNNKNDPNSLSQDYILNIYQSKKGEIWIGTFGGGLNKYIPSENGKSYKFLSYSENNGLPNNVIKSILEDDFGNLWISTNLGLSKFDPVKELFKNYDVNDGLQSNEFSELTGLKRKSGEFLFGGVNGFTAFYPNQIKDNTSKPKTVFTDFLINNKKIGIGEMVNDRVLLDKSINVLDKIHLLYKENSFSVEFASLHYSASKKNKYAFKLIGFNTNWIYTSSDNRYATYTNLSPGSYTLLVKSSNSDGIWNETPIKLEIIIIPPFWRSSLAYFIYLLLIIAILLYFKKYTTDKTNRKHQKKLELFENEKHEEMQKLKFEFFTNISHEFRTPLTLIKGPLEYLQKNVNHISSEKVAEQYNIMNKNVDFLMRLVNQLLDFRKMDKGKMDLVLNYSNLFEFVKLVGEPFRFLSLKKNITFEITSKLDNPQIWFDPDALEKILNNLLSNAFKFTSDGGKVSVIVSEGTKFRNSSGFDIKENMSDFIFIRVKDTGLGIPANRLKIIFERFYIDRDYRKVNTQGTGIGLDFTKKLVELHQGTIDVANNKKQGASFIIWLPKDKRVYENVPGISFGDSAENDVFTTESNAKVHAAEVLDEMADQNISISRSKLPLLLIVEDNTDIRTLIKQGLDKKYQIYEAENGQQGIEMANKIMPSIVLTDIFMPIMDGIEMCEKLKKAPETSHIPIVMLTAKTSEEWEKEGLINGADGYVRKPFNMELLELKIKNILNFREDLRKKFNRDVFLQPKEVTVNSLDEEFLQKAIEVIEKHMMNTEFSVELMVKEMAISRSNLYLKIKALTGLSSSEFIRNIRLKRAMQLLEQNQLSVKEIMYMTGFNTASYFSKCFKKQFGVIPSKYFPLDENENDIE